MKEEKLKIGEMAKFSNVAVSTLRLYDEIGILKPLYIDSETSYRYYSIKQQARLDMIQYMKELNMSLNEIKQIFDSHDIKQIELTLIKKKKQVKEEINELKLKQKAITRAIENIERFRTAPKDGMITVEYIPHRKVYFMQTDVNFYDNDISVYEKILNKLKNNMATNGLPAVYYCNAGTSLKKELFLEDKYISNEIFVFIDDDFPYDKNTKRIESGMYACIYLNSFDKEKEYAQKLKQFILDNNYIINGDYICEVMTEFNCFDGEKRSMYLKLQVPLSFK